MNKYLNKLCLLILVLCPFCFTSCKGDDFIVNDDVINYESKIYKKVDDYLTLYEPRNIGNNKLYYDVNDKAKEFLLYKEQLFINKDKYETIEEYILCDSFIQTTVKGKYNKHGLLVNDFIVYVKDFTDLKINVSDFKNLYLCETNNDIKIESEIYNLKFKTNINNFVIVDCFDIFVLDNDVYIVHDGQTLQMIDEISSVFYDAINELITNINSI